MSETGYAAVYSILYAVLQCDAKVEGQRLWGVCNVCMHALEGQKTEINKKNLQNRSGRLVISLIRVRYSASCMPIDPWGLILTD